MSLSSSRLLVRLFGTGSSRVLAYQRHSSFITLAFLVGWSFACKAQTNIFPEFRPEGARAYWQTLAQTMTREIGTNVDGYFCLARLQSELGEKGEAERLARATLAANPERVEIDMFLAEALIRQDRMEEAAACLREAIKRDPKVTGGYRQLGMVLDRLGDHAGARQAFDSAVQQQPRDPGGWLLRGKSLLDDGKLKEAVADLEKACQLDPDTANAYYPLFQAQSKLGNREAAQVALKKFQELKKVENQKAEIGILTDKPSDNEPQIRAFTAETHQAAAAVLLRCGNTAAAENHLRQALSIIPQDAAAYELLSRVCLENGRLAEARTNLEEVVRLRPNAVGDRVNLGTLLLQLRDYPAGVAELKRALELDPKRVEALHNLARYYLTSRKEPAEALAFSKRLVEADASAASYDLLAWAYFANSRTNDAIAASAEAVRKDPGSTVYSNRLRRLQQLARTQ